MSHLLPCSYLLAYSRCGASLNVVIAEDIISSLLLWSWVREMKGFVATINWMCNKISIPEGHLLLHLSVSGEKMGSPQLCQWFSFIFILNQSFIGLSPDREVPVLDTRRWWKASFEYWSSTYKRLIIKDETIFLNSKMQLFFNYTNKLFKWF